MNERAERRLPTPVTGLSYRRSTAAIAVALTLAVFVYGGRLLGTSAGVIPSAILLLMAGAGVVMAMTCWFIVFGTTTVDAEGIRQTWIVPRSWRWDEIQRVKLLRMPWSTRLILVGMRGPLRAVHGGTPALEAAFREVVEMYRLDRQ